MKFFSSLLLSLFFITNAYATQYFNEYTQEDKMIVTKRCVELIGIFKAEPENHVYFISKANQFILNKKLDNLDLCDMMNAFYELKTDDEQRKINIYCSDYLKNYLMKNYK